MPCANFANSRNERAYAQIEATYGIVPNTAGTATVGNNNCFRFQKFDFSNDVALIERSDKTGSRSAPIGTRGRSQVRDWNLSLTNAPNGVAGVAPDFDALMQMTFGQAGTALSGTATVTAASNATPIVITATNTFAAGDLVFISGVTGNTAANGLWQISAVSGSAFTLVGSVGNAAYVSGGTASKVGYKYGFTDSILSGSLWSFRTPTTVDQTVMHGSVVSGARFEFGGDEALITFRGQGQWALKSNQFSVADLTQKGGLTTFPTEPSAPVTNGTTIAGFTGYFMAAGTVLGTIQRGVVDIETGNQLITDNFGSYYPFCTQGDVRRVSLDFSCYEDDSTAWTNLITAAESKTPIQIVLVQGTASGSICAQVINNVQLATPRREENLRFLGNFQGSMAHATTLLTKDEIVTYFF